MAKSKKNKNKAKLNLTVRDEQRNKLEQMAPAGASRVCLVASFVVALVGKISCGADSRIARSSNSFSSLLSGSPKGLCFKRSAKCRNVLSRTI